MSTFPLAQTQAADLAELLFGSFCVRSPGHPARGFFLFWQPPDRRPVHRRGQSHRRHRQAKGYSSRSDYSRVRFTDTRTQMHLELPQYQRLCG